MTNSLKILDSTKTELFQLKFFQCDQKIWQNYCRADLSSFSDLFTCCLSMRILRRGFLGIKVTTLFAVYNFVNTSAMRLTVFSKCSKFDVDFRNAEKNWEHIFNFKENCIWFGCMKHPLLPRENTCRREWLC